MSKLTSLINIAKRIHNTEASRTEILQDLANISEKEYQELEQALLIQLNDIISIEETQFLVTAVGREPILKKPGMELTPLRADGHLKETDKGGIVTVYHFYNINK
jgi:hypothetical protein